MWQAGGDFVILGARRKRARDRCGETFPTGIQSVSQNRNQQADAPRRPAPDAADALRPQPEPLPEPRPVEIGGRPDGTEPTRFGDWEKNGRCIDF